MENTTKNTEEQPKVVNKELKKVADIFEGADETMELNQEEAKQLTEFETMNKEGKEIEFDKVKISDLGNKPEHRRIPVPRHRMAPLRTNWDSILKTLVDHMKL